jgi:hypothetical protein
MIKKSIALLLVLTFLNLMVVSDFASAEIGPSGGAVEAVFIGGLVVVGLIIFGISKLSKKTDAPAEQPQDQKQELPQGLNLQQPDEQPLTPSGQLTVLGY